MWPCCKFLPSWTLKWELISLSQRTWNINYSNSSNILQVPGTGATTVEAAHCMSRVQCLVSTVAEVQADLCGAHQLQSNRTGIWPIVSSYIVSLWVLSCFNCVWFCASQADHSLPGSSAMGFSRKEYWGWLPFLPPGDLPIPGIKSVSLRSPILASGFFTTSNTWEAPKFPRCPQVGTPLLWPTHTPHSSEITCPHVIFLESCCCTCHIAGG